MRLIVGLGNPGRRYRGTRHNLGREVVDLLSSAHRIPLSEEEGWSEIGRGSIGGHRLLLARPGTYMNVVGTAVADLRRRHRLRADQILVAVDDLDLAVGAVRIRESGGHGGHNGLRSIIDSLATTQFVRLRLGIGRPPEGVDPADYVLDRPTAEERTLLDVAVSRAAEGAALWAVGEIEAAMRLCNPRPAGESP